MKRFLLAFFVLVAATIFVASQGWSGEQGQGRRSGAERNSQESGKGERRSEGGPGLSFGRDGGVAPIGIIDTHVHIARNNRRRGQSFAALAADAIRSMDGAGIELSILLPPPFPPDHDGAYGWGELSRIAAAYPQRIAVVAGGDSLNAMVLSTNASDVKPSELDAFRKEALRLAESGVAGYGEFALEHFSSGQGQHPYLTAPPDHPLLFALADIAAERGLPMDVHMEAVPQDMDMPDRRANEENPSRLRANLTAFERLLNHNARAKIVWAHAGWDLSGERSVATMQRMLTNHTNLYMSIKIDRSGTPANNPMTESGIKENWLGLLRAFPDRFVIGSDQFYDSELSRLNGVKSFMLRLPPELASKIGRTNARAIYRLPAR